MTRLNETCLSARLNAMESEVARTEVASAPPFARRRGARPCRLGAFVVLSVWVALWSHFILGIAAPAGRLGARPALHAEPAAGRPGLLASAGPGR
jgi:ferric-dicitrate binding protein FerR (iron transport regulator)